MALGHRCIVRLLALHLLVAGGASAASADHAPGHSPSLPDLLELRVSTASKYEQLARRAPASVSVITAEEIAEHGYRTLAEALVTLPGFYLSYDRNYVFLGVRGFSRPSDYNNRLLLLIDGQALNESVFGSTWLGTDLGLDMAAVDRIEVVRGPGSALYGTGAMLAVVNVILQRGAAAEGARLTLGAGSAGQRRVAVTGGLEGPGNAELFVSAFADDVAGRDLYYPEYAEAGGVAHGLDYDRPQGAVTKGRYGDFGLLLMGSTREKGIPTGSYGTAFGDPAARTVDRRQLAELQYERALGSQWALRGRGYLHHMSYDGVYPYDRPSYDSSDNRFWGGEVQARWDPRVEQRVIAGVELRRNDRAEYRAWDDEATQLDGNLSSTVVSFYAQDELQLTRRLSLVAGLRHDRYSHEGGYTTPRAALVWFPSPTATFKLLYGNAFRVASIYESHLESFTSGSPPAMDLRPEEVRTVEAIWEQRLGGGLQGCLALYDSQMHDLLDPVEEGALATLRFANQGRARTRGGELSMSWRAGGGASAYGSYAYQRAEDAATGEELTNAPRHAVTLGGSRQLRAWLRAATDLRYEGGRLTVQGTRTAPFWLADLTLSVAPPRAPWHVRVLLDNLFDRTWATPGGLEHRQAAIVQDGRRWLVSVDWKVR